MPTPLRRPASVAILLALAASLLAGSPTPAAAAVAGTLALSDSVVAPGAPVTFSGSLPPRRSRSVRLQYRVSGTWATLVSKKSSATGTFRVTTNAPPQAGARAYRVYAPATRLGGRRYAAVSSPTRTLTVVAITDIDAGWRHQCAVGSDASAWCWGDNTYGELGDGAGGGYDDNTPEVSSGPVRVVGGNWDSVSTDGASTCGLKRDRTAWCWGDLAMPVLGVPKAASPVQVPGEWDQIAAGWFTACGVKGDGSGWCWGANDGALGTGDPVPQGSMNQLPGTWLMIVPGGASDGSGNGYFTCGIKADRSAWCWGDNTRGQLGNDSTDSSPTPVTVVGDQQWSSITVGGSHACGVTTAGAGWCWGGNTPGQLGNFTPDPSDPDRFGTDQHTPVQIQVDGPWVSLDAGFQHTCGVTTTGEGWCWGWNDSGQQGDGTDDTAYFPEPKATQQPGRWMDLAAGHDHTGAVQRPGLVRSWGASGYGQTGHGRQEALRLTPWDVAINP